MKVFVRSIFLVLCILFASHTAHAGKIKRGFQALQVYDYFKAKKLFEKGMKYSPSAGAYGLAKIYMRSDNPFSSLDSAYKYVNLSKSFYPEAKDGKKLRWAVYGWTDAGIDSLRQEISTLFYLNTTTTNTVTAYQTFIDEHPWAHQKQRAMDIRDSLAFFNAVNSNTSEAYNNYFQTYPQSRYADLAKANYYDTQFQEITGDGSLASYIEFVKMNPNSPLVKEAERNIYEIVTEPNTLEAYEAFMSTYPENQFVATAERMHYEVFIATDFSVKRMKEFIDTYPTTSLKDSLLGAIELEEQILLPTYISDSSGFGFMDSTGNVVLKGFDMVSGFSEGLAIFISSETNKYGAIDRTGKVRIPALYDEMSDFLDGKSVVSLKDQLGVIHRNGRFVMPCEFEDIGSFSSGLIYAAKNGLYGYYNEFGLPRIEAKFEDAYDFVEGKAKVVSEGKEALIDIYGTYVVPPVVESFTPFSDSVYVFEEDGYYGLMNHLGKVILEPNYDYIGVPVDGLAIASDGEFVEYLNERGEVVISNGFEVYPNYALRGEFLEGAAVVFKNEKYGRINKSGKLITELKYENLGRSNQAIPFQKEGLWGLMNFANKAIVSVQFNTVETQGDYFVVQKDGLFGVVDATGSTIVPFNFKEIQLLEGKTFAVSGLNGQWGIFKDSHLKVPMQYQSVRLFDKDFVLLDGSTQAYFELSTNRVITLKTEGE